MRRSIQSLLNDRTSGASALFHALLQELSHLDEDEFRLALFELQQTFPAMAVWKYLDTYFANRSFTKKHIQDLKTLAALEKARVLDGTSKTLSAYTSFLTLSQSSLVTSFFEQRAEQEKIYVVCSESLPGLEGRALTKTLNSKGVTTRCVQDWTLVEELANSEAVLFGADWVTDDFVVNKQGSREVVDRAIQDDKPVFFLAEAFKHTEPVDFKREWCYQDWSEGDIQRRIKVFDIIPRSEGLIIL
ncbi:MAG: hypothetical protein K9M49_05645 [Candidatus Marinimicrobia bacterium]|nr:hypothetical protein [Candidatus Neomarinimicrobiota bacterium]MCF7904621.1 hypothetical protein [Candidatus Neomarinimicrobiota bacterium]